MPSRSRLLSLLALALACAASAYADAPADPAGTAASPPPSSPAPIATGAPFGADVKLPEHADEVVRYVLEAKLDPEHHAVEGSGTIHWRNASRVPVREMWVHLYLNAFKNERSVFLREPVGGFRGGDPVDDWGAIDVHKLVLRQPGGAGGDDLWPTAELRRAGDDDETDARVPLPRDVAPGEAIDVDVTWTSKLPSVVERTGYVGSFHMVAQWFPKIARLEPDGRWAHYPFHHLAEFYADFGSYDVTLDVPSAFTIGATGPLEGAARVVGGRRIERHVQADVHDFAWTAWDRWETASDVVDGVRVTALYPPGYAAIGARELDTIRFAIPDFGARYGRYPYAVLTLVHPPETAGEAGGMEYPTLITTGGPWYVPAGVREAELVTIHEFGHQYFYGLLASDEVTWPFLDEGINSFAEVTSMGRWLGAGSMASLFGLTVSDATVHAAASGDAVHDTRVAQPAYAFPTGGDYGRLVYSRTATTLETLRRVYGDDAFGRAIGHYARANRFGHPTPDDLLGALGRDLGPVAAEAARAALFDRGWVDFAVEGVASHAVTPARGLFDRDGKRETVTTAAPEATYEGWVLVARRGTIRLPVDVDLELADRMVQRVRWDGDDEWVRLPYRGTVALRGAVVDPDHAVLLDDRVDDNHAVADKRTIGRAPWSGAPRTFERVVYWAELVAQGVMP